MASQSSGGSAKELQATGPLVGVRVVDLTSVVLGPLATRILGDFGADVVKIEGIEGDIMRSNGISRHPGMSSIFLSLNRNKRSIAVNLKSAEGKQIVLKLLASADVLVHNMRPAAMSRLGLSYADVKAVNESIVYCAATGFGQAGPHRNRPAFDDVIQAACGVADLTRSETGAPQYSPTLIADKTAGMAVVQGILAALFYRQRTGIGQYVEIPMFETLVEFTLAEHMGGLAFEPQHGPPGYGRITDGGRAPFPTADGYMALLPYNPEQWRALLEDIGSGDIMSRYGITDRQSLNSRVRELNRELAQLTPRRSTAEWLAICEKLDIAATPVHRLEELSTHPHLSAVSLFEAAEHPTEGSIRYTRPATAFELTPAGVYRFAPVAGQDTREILTSLGYTPERIDELGGLGIVAESNSAASPLPECGSDVV